MPTDKAHGIQIAKMSEALIEAGASLVLVLPSRGSRGSLKEFYGLRVDIPVVYVPALNLYNFERVGYVLASLSFMFSYTIFLWWQRLRGEDFVLYTVDLDAFSSAALAYIGRPLISEMHGGKVSSVPTRILFRALRAVVCINKIIAEQLQNTFPQPQKKYLIEPNGVDIDMFCPKEKAAARKRLGLPEQPTVLYTGRFYDWKGLEIVPQAARLTPQMCYLVVGGTKEEFASLVAGSIPENVHFRGVRPHSEMPEYIAAADALLVLGTSRDQQSYQWTSPMKLFEYLPTGRPIVASKTPAICAAVSEKEVFFYEPDNAEDLSQVAMRAAFGGSEVDSRVAQAATQAQKHTWAGRAARVLQCIHSLS